MSDARISLDQQIEAMGLACDRQNALANGLTLRPLGPKSGEQYQLARLQAIGRTLRWLRDQEATIRTWLAMSPEARDAALSMAEELQRRMDVAAAGGPVR